MEQLSLFGMNEESTKKEEKAFATVPNKILSLNTVFRIAVDRYLSEEIQSATQIAEKLIAEEGAPKDRFISGKPKIYIDVCEYLDSLNDVQIIENKMDKTDRIYQLIK
ncbi:DUF3895 domain-containing protein [Ammoniphilus resinae]|uniref:Uncharacterized protein n=1 Tax=Ammoniphilus resinae TaxID=861532 RepID=A0ABS4GNX6_9BACL|nr:DUF3895 domain-containing protein [Ammoniphilus resinae]MBP1931982.1 hypothetical protein [Ammoniphilus resinae]